MGSTWPDDAPELKPAVDLNRKARAPHPTFARTPVTEVGHGAGMVPVRTHARSGRAIPSHYRAKPAASSMAPPTNPNERDWLPGGKAS